mmetsp:Transcript_82063/g.206461  ORF Transcript_82063/g.206461 Transcript_82063/m.206461 type:complete len:516 (-) Transcript_82063:67-1614(-)
MQSKAGSDARSAPFASEPPSEKRALSLLSSGRCRLLGVGVGLASSLAGLGSTAAVLGVGLRQLAHGVAVSLGVLPAHSLGLLLGLLVCNPGSAALLAVRRLGRLLRDPGLRRGGAARGCAARGEEPGRQAAGRQQLRAVLAQEPRDEEAAVPGQRGRPGGEEGHARAEEHVLRDNVLGGFRDHLECRTRQLQDLKEQLETGAELLRQGLLRTVSFAGAPPKVIREGGQVTGHVMRRLLLQALCMRIVVLATLLTRETRRRRGGGRRGRRSLSTRLTAEPGRRHLSRSAVPGGHEAARALLFRQARRFCGDGIPDPPMVASLTVHPRVHCTALAVLWVDLADPGLETDGGGLRGQPLPQVVDQDLLASTARLLRHGSRVFLIDVAAAVRVPGARARRVLSVHLVTLRLLNVRIVIRELSRHCRWWTQSHPQEAAATRGPGRGEEVLEGGLDQSAQVALVVLVLRPDLAEAAGHPAQRLLHGCEIHSPLDRHPVYIVAEDNLQDKRSCSRRTHCRSN